MDREYKIFINNVDYSEYLVLPFSYNIRADQTYDNAAFTLDFTKVSEPFRPYTEVRIEIRNSLGYKDIIYHVIEEDSVVEKYSLKEIFYTHNITTIERTKLLDGIMVPSFSVTNPAKSTVVTAYTGTTGKWEKLTEDYTGNGITGFGDSFISGYTTYISSLYYSGNNNSEIRASLDFAWRSQYSFDETEKVNTVANNSEIKLMVPYSKVAQAAAQAYSRYDKKVIFTVNKEHAVTADLYKSFDNVIQYYYRNSGDSTNNIIGYLICDRESVQAKSFQIVDSTRFKVENGYPYFLIKEEETLIVGCRIVKPGDLYDSITYPVNGEYKVLNYLKNIMYRSLNDLCDKIGYTKLAETSNITATSKDDYCNQIASLMVYRTKYEDFHVNNPETYDATFEINMNSTASGSTSVVLGANDYKRVKDVLEKAISLLPEDFGSFSIEKIPTSILNTIVSERIYNEKTLSEILFDLANLVNAYPELDDNNNILYEYLTPLDNPLFADSTQNESFSINTDNAVSTYVSNMSNVINTPTEYKEYYSYWPSKNSFAHPTGTLDNYSVTPDTSAIVINTNGIYYLAKLEVTNCCNTASYTSSTGNTVTLNSSTVVDISDFIYEETYYNTLYNNQIGAAANFSKDNCLYWTKGGNKIILDELESKNRTAIYGNSDPDTYKIQNAIRHALAIKYSIIPSNITLGNNPTNYRYRVTYIDIMNGRFLTEKFNSPDVKVINSNYNQESNTINGGAWCEKAQVDILRRNNISRSKAVKITNLSQTPLLGETLTDSSGRYFADSINFTFDNSEVECLLSYTKDYNKINKDVSISKEYRQYEIYNENTIDRNVNINRYCYLTKNSELSGTENSNIKFTNQLRPDTKKEIPSLAVVFFKDKNKNLISYTVQDDTAETGVSTKTSTGFIIPLSYISGGNTFILEGKAMDNYAIAYYPDMNSDIQYDTVMGTTKSTGARVLTDARYVDDLGEATYMSFYLINPAYNSELTSLTEDNIKEYPTTGYSEDQISNFALDSEVDMKIDKDNRERLIFVYQMHFLTKDDNIRWNPALIKYLFYGDEGKNKIFSDLSGTVIGDNYPSYYGFSYDVSNNTFADSGKFLNIPEITNAGHESVNGSNIDISAYSSVALVYPKTNEIIYHIQPDSSVSTIPTVYFNYYKHKLT